MSLCLWRRKHIQTQINKQTNKKGNTHKRKHERDEFVFVEGKKKKKNKGRMQEVKGKESRRGGEPGREQNN